jgi:archaellum biogenesis ATPase FlaH
MIETLILRNLLQNESYTRKVIPFLKREYFEGAHKLVFDTTVEFVNKYNKLPTTDALLIEMGEDIEKVVDLVPSLQESDSSDQGWLVDQTEKWCQDRAIYLAIMESISIIDGSHKQLSKNSLPDLLSKALSVSFDTNIGHDYINDATSRFDFYHLEEEKIPFDIDLLNKITKGGLPKKTLNIFLAGTGVGKSLFMCHHAASCLSMSKNVLYITMEMAEEKIAERIDANLMNLPIDQLETVSKEIFDNKIQRIVDRGIGKLIIKEYPTGAAHVGHFRALLNELKLKKNFVPDIIMIDYLNICSSSRMKGVGGSINTYSYIKSIAEEMRGLAVEFNVPIVSATQTTRSGFSNTDVELTDTSESFGLPATADFMAALISTEELEGLGQIMIKQLKNRYNDPTYKKRFVVGIDRSRMRLFDVEDHAQTLIGDTTSSPVPPKSKLIKDGLTGIKV